MGSWSAHESGPIWADQLSMAHCVDCGQAGGRAGASGLELGPEVLTMKQRVIQAAVVVIAAGVLAVVVNVYTDPARRGRGMNVTGTEMMQGITISPPVDSPEIVSVEEAVPTWVRPEELVLGVVVNGEARAYPLNVLTGPMREIINDTLGDTPIAATW